jgi:Rne/Rng family ribonuclease
MNDSKKQNTGPKADRDGSRQGIESAKAASADAIEAGGTARAPADVPAGEGSESVATPPAKPRKRRTPGPSRRKPAKPKADAVSSAPEAPPAAPPAVSLPPAAAPMTPVAPAPAEPLAAADAVPAESAPAEKPPRSRRGRGGRSRGRGRHGKGKETPVPAPVASEPAVPSLVEPPAAAPARTPAATRAARAQATSTEAPAEPTSPRRTAEPLSEEAEVDASVETVSGIVRQAPIEAEPGELDMDTLAELELQAAEAAAEAAARRGAEPEEPDAEAVEEDAFEPAAQATAEAVTGEMPPRRRRRRRRGRGRRGRGREDGQPLDQHGQPQQGPLPQAGDGTATLEPGTVVEPAAPRQAGPARPQPGQPRQQQPRGPRPPRQQPPARPQPLQELPVVEPRGEDEEEEAEQPLSNKTMLVNLAQSDECRIAMLEDGRLQEFYVERTAALSHVGNVYKGVITNIEPSIQAAFIDFGEGKNGFLHISDLQPQYFPGGGEAEDVGRKTPRKERPPIQKCLRRNQEVIVQVTKEGIGTKGATLTTYVALPGRYLVMMPGMSRLGVSRKIEDEEARRRMRDVLNQLELPGEMGFILRTAGLDRSKQELQRDLNYLARLWKQVMNRKAGVKAPAELYRESDLVTRTLRDVVTVDVKEVLIDSEPVAQSAKQFLRLLSPRLSERVKFYNDVQPLFFRYGVEEEIAKMYSKRVPLRSGGSLVIESTEALVAIDVNSGKFREAPDPEESAFRINLEAADEIARQLSLRDLGGVIICDFIDMHLERHRREIERALRESLKKQKERAEILRMSRFGIIEMTRQRQRASIVRSMLVECPHCGGDGLIKSTETLMLEALRAIQTAATQTEVVKIEVRVNPQVAQLLLNSKRQVLADLESKADRTIVIIPMPEAPTNKITVNCLDARGWAVQVPLPKSMLNGGPA